MSSRPDYFEEIRGKAAKRWEQLEADPELAGPWHQLFKQVQSPRHVVSELLQNADDAGATEASVRIEDGAFIFEHNGGDFTAEHFASLCRFGYSSKRALHTIGFRGIGFKSTFSLGDRVELYTPSLAIEFSRARFTEPRWSGEPRADGNTCVRVAIGDHHRQTEVQKNLKEWLKSPVSLLFFKHIRKVQIDDQVMHWTTGGAGPVQGSEWMALDDQDDRYLLLRSREKPFPEEALAEIRQERMLTPEEEIEFPPSRVELVLGAAGKLYVVLPTLVETALPFACNAPFIQDPARLKIKDPETSPTNRWLLHRAGRLVGKVMLDWLGQSELQRSERARAYSLLPDVNREDSSLEGVCGTIVEEAVGEALDDREFLLTDEGSLVADGKSIVIPDTLLQVWSAEQAATLLDEDSRPPLARDVREADRDKLLHWGLVEEIDKSDFISTLQAKHLPRPKTWRQLLTLWEYVAPEITGWWNRSTASDVRIVPVQGKEVLYAASEVVRLGEKKLLQSEDDWNFLSEHLIVLNQNWTRFLAEQRRAADELDKRHALRNAVDAAYAILDATGLDETSDTDTVVDQVAAEFFAEQEKTLAKCIQLAQIAAKLGAGVGDSFRFATRDLHLHAPDGSVLLDASGRLEELLPDSERDKRLLHSDYLAAFTSCTRDEWERWVGQGKSGLRAFPPLEQKCLNIWGKEQLRQEARKRGLNGDFSYPYKTISFRIDDWDFAESTWRNWESLAKGDDRIWGKVVEHILAQGEAYWGDADTAEILQIATTGSTRKITYESVLPTWAMRLRNLPCLPDTRGSYRKPSDLLRRTAETEALLDVEPFVDKLLDRETTQPFLDLLGVRSTPTGPDRIFEFLRALSKAERPPAHEVEKWYRRLDQMLNAASTADTARIKQAFQTEKLILTEDGSWTTAAGVFISSDEEDVPGAALVRASVRDLALWRRVGVEDHPTAELALAWLKAQPSGSRLSPDDARRVRALLVRHPQRVWDECDHWINLAGEWVPTDGLAYALTMQTLVPWSHLHQWVTQRTADFRSLPVELLAVEPFAGLPSLAAQIEERFDRGLLVSGHQQTKPWLKAAGAELSRIKLDSENETQRVRELGRALERTRWQTSPGIEIVPYIDGTPAGTARHADAIWLDEVLHVDELSKAKLAKRVPEEIGRSFGRGDIKAALDYGFERSAEDVRAYFEENFTLAPADSVPKPSDTAEESDEGPAEETEGRVASTDEEDIAEDTVEDDTDGDGDHSQPDEDDGFDPEPEERAPGSDGNGASRPRPVPKPPRPNLIERYAKTRGYQKDGEHRYFHADGSWIAKTHGSLFPWEERHASGDLHRYYWPEEHCLEAEPLQLKAEVWTSIDQHPELYALILTNPDGTPAEVTGDKLRAMREAGEVTLYPATYRIVYSNDRPE